MNAFPKWLIILVLIALVLLGLWYFSNIVICIVLAGLLSLITKPIFNFFRKIKLGKFQISASAAAIFTILSYLGFFLMLFALLVPLIIQQGNAISNIDLNKVMNDLREPITQFEKLLSKYNLLQDGSQSLRSYLQDYLTKLISTIDISDFLGGIFQIAGNLFFYSFSSLFILFFFLKDEKLLLNIVTLFTPGTQESKISATFDKVREMLFRYFIALVFQVTLISIYVTVFLYFFGIKNALLIGLLAGLLNLIPYLGPAIGLLVALILGTISHLHTGEYSEIFLLMLKISGVFMSMQFLDNNFLQPYIFSKSTNAHPLEIFIVIIAAATIAGVIGMVVAVPVYTIIRIIAAEFFGHVPLIQKLSGKQH